MVPPYYLTFIPFPPDDVASIPAEASCLIIRFYAYSYCIIGSSNTNRSLCNIILLRRMRFLFKCALFLRYRTKIISQPQSALTLCIETRFSISSSSIMTVRNCISMIRKSFAIRGCYLVQHATAMSLASYVLPVISRVFNKKSLIGYKR